MGIKNTFLTGSILLIKLTISFFFFHAFLASNSSLWEGTPCRALAHSSYHGAISLLRNLEDEVLS